MINWKKVEMGFFSCFGSEKCLSLNKDEETKGERLNKDEETNMEETKGERLNKDEETNLEVTQAAGARRRVSFVEPEPRRKSSASKVNINAENSASTFSYWELAAATNNFCEESVIGEGGFGSVHKGKLGRTGQVVAIKKLNPSGVQGTKEFLVEVLMLSLLHHPNLVKLIGFCAEGEERLLVYEYMPLGSLERHLHDRLPDIQPLDWDTRMTIAAGVASGLDYLHNEADPPVIHRDLKPSNILLGEGFHPKLSDFGLAKFGPSGDKSHVSTRVMGTYGYCAPEYALTGKLTFRSDVYCFGMVFLELITGRKAIDETRARGQHGLLDWVRPLLKDRKNLIQIADPETIGQFSDAAFRHALELALRCLQDTAQSRPNMKDVVPAINFLKSLVPAAAHSTSDGRETVSREEGRNKNTTGDDQGFEKIRQQGRKVNKDQERERAVAEAKLRGETSRDKMPSSKDEGGSELHESKTS